MNPPTPQPGGKLLRLGLGAAALGVLVLYNSVDAKPVDEASAPAASTSVSASAAPSAAAARGARAPALPRSQPTRIRIPQIAVDAPVSQLGLEADGRLAAPPVDNRNLVGWYSGGAAPGEAGSAVMAGHVDTKSGPAVFLLLSLLVTGNTVDVTRADGTTATFVVDSVETFAKNAFPDDRVYGDTPDAQLRLITCGGVYDHKAKDYTANVVVFAHLKA
ncbi:class F sortase [Kitasatospora terrestris]|uniref:Class F sortase n=1 Tax=Kitasatospora terrestris TaxID=258051 RepID=A0ABP9EHX8_9ACTN